MVAKEYSGVVVMQYVAAGRVRVSIESSASDSAAVASDLDGRLAPHAETTNAAVVRVKWAKCRRVMDVYRNSRRSLYYVSVSAKKRCV
jgi:hypothetical protein